MCIYTILCRIYNALYIIPWKPMYKIITTKTGYRKLYNQLTFFAEELFVLYIIIE